MNSSIIYKNINVNFSVSGKGSAVVLLHGFLEDSSMWVNVKEKVEQKHKVVCIDLLGHGKTDCLGYINTMEEMADMVRFVLKKERIRKATFIGHSMGGYVALAFADKYLENVKGLCLMNSTTQRDSNERNKLRLRAMNMAQTNYKALVTMSVNNLFTKEKRNAIFNEIEESKVVALKTSAQAYVACTEGMRVRENKEEMFEALTVNKMMIISRKDSVLNYSSIIDEVKRTKSPVIELSNGHMSHIENPKELLVAITSFLKPK